MRRMMAAVVLICAGCGGGAADSAKPTTTGDQPAANTSSLQRSTTTMVLSEPEQKFVEVARGLGVPLAAKDLISIGTTACDLAGQGENILRGYVVGTIEPASDDGQLTIYGLILGTAGIHLCPEYLSVLSAEVDRLRKPSSPVTRAPSPPSPGSRLGTRASPLPLGSEATLSNGWTLSVLGVTPNATDAVLAENQFNEPPPDGKQFFLVNINATYGGGEGSALPLGDISFSVVDSGNTQIREGDCGVVPAKFDFFTEVFDGGALSGNLCFTVPTSTTASLVMYADAGILSDQRAFFALS